MPHTWLWDKNCSYITCYATILWRSQIIGDLECSHWASFRDLQDTISHPLWVGYSATNRRKLKHAFNCDFGHLLTGRIYLEVTTSLNNYLNKIP